MTTKICNSCGRDLDIEMFHKRSCNKDGYDSICKECKSKRDKKYREQNKDILKEKSKKYREENKDIIAQKKKKYYQEHKQEILLKNFEYRKQHQKEKAARDKQYVKENQDKVQVYQKEYRETHKISNAEYQKRYREKNKDKLTEYKKSPKIRYKIYKRNAEKRNLDFNLSENEFFEISTLPCAYCGGYSDTYNDEWFNGIDRIDSNFGYSKNNIVPCCAICNRMKMDLNVNDWINQMIKIINYYNV